MAHKPEINDIYLSKEIGDKSIYSSKWIIENTICPLCDMICYISIHNTHDGNNYEDYDISTYLTVDCLGECNWRCEFNSYNWNESHNKKCWSNKCDIYESCDKINIPAWKMYCVISTRNEFTKTIKSGRKKDSKTLCKVGVRAKLM